VIVRAFHATATPAGADAYHQHFTRSVLPDLQRIDGYQGAYLLWRDHDRHVELQVLTLWDSWRRSAGSPDRTWSTPWSNLPPQAALATYDPTVTHHTVVVDTVGTSGRIGQ
jgi:hypothetical protein